MKITKSIKNQEVKREWLLIDAKDKIFGRLVSEIALKLRGKHKTYFTPHVDCGDYIVVVNASQVKFSTPAKLEDKFYHRHTGYTGSVKSTKLANLVNHNPEKLFKLATRGMLPKNKLGRMMLKKLKVYSDADHPHTAQIKV